MKAFTGLDDFLIDEVFQKFAWWFQKLTGRTNFWLARASYLMAALFVIPWLIPFQLSPLPSSLVIMTILALLYLAATLWINQKLKEIEKKFLERQSEEATVSQFRIVGVPLRIIGIFVCLIISGWSILFYKVTANMGFLWGIAFSVFSVKGLYFFSCTPLPPGKSKVKEWLKSLKAKFIPVYGEN